MAAIRRFDCANAALGEAESAGSQLAILANPADA
jgi:hypothetical protein